MLKVTETLSPLRSSSGRLYKLPPAPPPIKQFNVYSKIKIMIGIISIDGESPSSNESMAGVILPDNLAEAAEWSFVAASAGYSTTPVAPNSEAFPGASASIRKHLREVWITYKLRKGLHEAIAAIEGIGKLVNRRDQGLYPRVTESQLQEEFEILRIQLEGIRQRTFFNKALFGSGATPPFKIHTSLWDIPRHEEVSTADLESLSLRLMDGGRLAGKGIQAPIHAKTVEDALRHLLETALKNQAEQERLRNVFKSLADTVRKPVSDEAENEVAEDPGILPVEEAISAAETVQSEAFLARLKAWVLQLLPADQTKKGTDKNFHHNQDAAS